MSRLPELLARYEALWAERGSPEAARLRPGRPAHEVRSALEAEGLEAPREILEWFAWHDGAERLGAVALPPSGYWPFSLEQACAERRELLEFAQWAARQARELKENEEDQDPEFWWRTGWLPLLKFGGGECAAADLGGARRGAVPLRTWAPYEPQEAHAIAAPSLSVVVAYWSEAVECCCRWDADAEHPHWVTDRSRMPPRPPDVSSALG